MFLKLTIKFIAYFKRMLEQHNNPFLKHRFLYHILLHLYLLKTDILYKQQLELQLKINLHNSNQY